MLEAPEDSASGAAYAWHRDNIPVPGAHGPQLDLGPAHPGHNGRWSVVVSNAFGVVRHEIARLYVPRAPGFPGQDADEGPGIVNGVFTLPLRGEPGQLLRVERTAALDGPWGELARVWLDAAGRGLAGEALAAAAGGRFYRLAEEAPQLAAEDFVRRGAATLRTWRLDGGRAGQRYRIERRSGSDTWTPVAEVVAGPGGARFEAPAGVPREDLRVVPAG